jgi:hypothetical protein
MKRTAALGVSFLVAAALATTSNATHTLPDPKPGAEPAPCGVHHDLAAEAIADSTMPGAKEVRFQNSPDPFPPPFCTPAAAAP